VEEIVRLYRLKFNQLAQDTRACYNICPTTIIPTVAERDSNRELVPMRWGE